MPDYRFAVTHVMPPRQTRNAILRTATRNPVTHRTSNAPEIQTQHTTLQALPPNTDEAMPMPTSLPPPRTPLPPRLPNRHAPPKPNLRHYFLNSFHHLSPEKNSKNEAQVRMG